MSASSFWITECHFTVLRDIPLNPFLTLHHQHRDAGCSLSSREQQGHWDEARTAAGWTHASVQCSCVSVNSSWGQTPPLFTLLPHPSTSQHAPCTACWERACRSCTRTKENQGVWHCKGLGIHIWISFWSCYRLTWSPPVQVVSVTLTPSPTSAFKHCGCISFFHTH